MISSVQSPAVVFPFSPLPTSDRFTCCSFKAMLIPAWRTSNPLLWLGAPVNRVKDNDLLSCKQHSSLKTTWGHIQESLHPHNVNSHTHVAHVCSHTRQTKINMSVTWIKTMVDLRCTSFGSSVEREREREKGEGGIESETEREKMH